MRIVKSFLETSLRKQERFAGRTLDAFAGKVEQTTIAVWSLSVKARTDDKRDSPAISCIEKLFEAGMTIRAYDPEAIPTAKEKFGERIEFSGESYQMLDGADALVILTDWQEFRTPDFGLIASKLKKAVIFDGRNLYDPAFVKKAGIEYYCVGRV